MPNPVEQDRQRKIEELRKRLETLLEFDPTQLMRLDLSDLGFQSARAAIDGIFSLANSMQSGVDLDATPPGDATAAAEVVSDLIDKFNELKAFRLGENASHQAGIIRDLYNLWTRSSATLRPIVLFYAKQHLDTSAAEARTLLAELSAQKKEAEKGLELINKQMAEAGVSQQAIHFKTAADHNLVFSVVWLIATGMAAVTILVYVIRFAAPEIAASPVDAPIRRLVALAAPRAIIFSVFWFAMIFCARNYTASRHNTIVNRHRQNALSTFRQFILPAEDPETKNAVLLQATQCIFSPQTTGYLKGESEPQQGNQVVEIFRTMPTPKLGAEAK